MSVQIFVWLDRQIPLQEILYHFISGLVKCCSSCLRLATVVTIAVLSALVVMVFGLGPAKF